MVPALRRSAAQPSLKTTQGFVCQDASLISVGSVNEEAVYLQRTRQTSDSFSSRFISLPLIVNICSNGSDEFSLEMKSLVYSSNAEGSSW